MKLKQLFFQWAYLDIEHSNKKEDTYFKRFSKEIEINNLHTARNLAVFFCIISVFVIISSLTFFKSVDLVILYSVIISIQLIVCALASYLIKKQKSSQFSTLFSSLYLVHILAFGAYIGTALSRDESAPVFMVVLVLSQMLFILPPILTTIISAIATVGTLVTSYFIKSTIFFESDVINCIGVFILSILLGWMINKIRAEEAFARLRMDKMNEKFKLLSVTDQLTSLPNHRNFQDRYYDLFKESQCNGTPIGVIVMDIDKFKRFNDHYGHIAGDECLSSIGKIFHSYQSKNVTIYRFGGEEFVALVKGSSCANTPSIAENLRLSVEKMSIPHEFSTAKVVTISVVYHVEIPPKNELPTNLLDNADRAMYHGKSKGGNCTNAYE